GEAPVADGMAEEGEEVPPPPAKETPKVAAKPAPKPAEKAQPSYFAGAPRAEGEKPLASPAVRLRAREAGVDLRQVAGSGPAGRITHEDIDGFLSSGRQGSVVKGLQRRTDIEDVKIVGLRRKIAEKMALSKRSIPHITYVEEIDVTA